MAAETPQEFHLTVVDADRTPSPVTRLAQASGLSHRAIKDAMGKGAVWLERNGQVRRLRRHKAPLKAGDRLHLYYNPKVLEQQPPPATLIADEQAFSVWDKPPGMLSQGSKWGDHTSIVRYAEVRLQRVGFLVHRLDRAASGLILVAHSKQAARHLTALFEQRRVQKTYRVRVHGCFPESPRDFDAELDGRTAISHARRLSFDLAGPSSLLEVRIKTGRRHQIRRHLAQAGYPVVSDRLYGSESEEQALQLRAVALRFELNGEHAYSLADDTAS